MTASLVQSKSNGASGSSLTVTFTTAVTAGNAVVVAVGAVQGTVPTVSGITLGSAALTKASAIGGGANVDVEYWILAGAPSGQTVVTVTFTGGSGGGTALQAWAMEWSGMAASGLLDKAPAGGSGSSTSFSSGSSGTLSQAAEVVFGAAVVSTITATVTAPGAPWTELATLGAGTGVRLVAGYQVVSATTAQTYSGTISVSSPWNSIIISLNQASSTTPVSDTDTGTGADTAGPPVISGADAGTGTDSGTAVIAAGDTAAGTDTATVTVAGSDTAAGADAGSAVLGTTGSDAGTGTEAGTLAASVPGADTGTGTDSGTVRAPAAGSDTGSGADSATVLVLTEITGSDTGSGAEAGSVTVRPMVLWKAADKLSKTGGTMT